MRVFSTKKIVEGSILSALFFILSLSSIYLPLVGIFLSFLSPLPILILTIRQGLKISFFSTIIGALLIALFSNFFQGIFVFFQFGILGMVLGYTILKGFDIYKIFIIGVIVSLISKGIIIVLGMWITGINPLTINLSSMEKSLSSAFKMYSKMGIPEESLKNIESSFKQALKFVKIALPSIFILASIFDVFLNYTVSSIILKKLEYDVPKLPRFRELRGSLTFAVGFFGGIILTIFFWHIPILYKIGVNLQLFFTIIFFILGISLVSYILYKFNVPSYVKILIYFLLIFQPLFAQITLWAGFLDVFFDFRAIIENKFKNKGR